MIEPSFEPSGPSGAPPTAPPLPTNILLQSVICSGESGTGATPFAMAYADSIAPSTAMMLWNGERRNKGE